jgi:uncharacterized protein (UPF0332 family)
MKQETGPFLHKAARAVHAVETLLGAGDADFAAGRAYYAKFYVAEALLNERRLHFRKHGGVHAAFGEHFAKSGLFDPQFHRWLLDAFDKRIQGDYGFEATVTPEDAASMIQQAREFLEEARRYLGIVESA